MAKIFKLLLPFLMVSWGGMSNALAQVGMVGQEIGIVGGPIAYFSDYGLRYDMNTNTGNTGTGIGIVYYLNFAYKADCNCYATYSYFNDHFRVRAEADYHWGRLNHFGEVAQKNTVGGRQLRAMVGNIKAVELGAHLEYYPLSIRDYTAFAYPISPYLSLGANFVSFDPYTFSKLGPLDDPNNVFHEFRGYIDQEPQSTWSIVLGAGLRYKLDVSSDLVMNLNWRYYDTDWLDGLDHENPQNKYNDMVFWLNFGYIYYLNF